MIKSTNWRKYYFYIVFFLPGPGTYFSLEPYPPSPHLGGFPPEFPPYWKSQMNIFKRLWFIIFPVGGIGKRLNLYQMCLNCDFPYYIPKLYTCGESNKIGYWKQQRVVLSSELLSYIGNPFQFVLTVSILQL